MKICQVCQESNHDAAQECILCGASLPVLPSQPETRTEQAQEELLLPAEPKAPTNKLALAIYHDSQNRVVAFFPIENDIMTIGREDASAGHFPDIDVSTLEASGVGASFVSRRHARILNQAEGLTLQVMANTTGTQVNRGIVTPGLSARLNIGDRIILGGRVRMKLMQF
jgi:hypothetical protein